MHEPLQQPPQPPHSCLVKHEARELLERQRLECRILRLLPHMVLAALAVRVWGGGESWQRHRAAGSGGRRRRQRAAAGRRQPGAPRNATMPARSRTAAAQRTCGGPAEGSASSGRAEQGPSGRLISHPCSLQLRGGQREDESHADLLQQLGGRQPAHRALAGRTWAWNRLAGGPGHGRNRWISKGRGRRHRGRGGGFPGGSFPGGHVLASTAQYASKQQAVFLLGNSDSARCRPNVQLGPCRRQHGWRAGCAMPWPSEANEW